MYNWTLGAGVIASATTRKSAPTTYQCRPMSDPIEA